MLSLCAALAGCGDKDRAEPRSAGDEAPEPAEADRAEQAEGPAEAGEPVPSETAEDAGGAGAAEERVGKEVTVTGTAANAKLGAVVVGADRTTYYVGGLDAWDEEMRGEEVQVSGVLQRKKLSPDPEVGPEGEVSAGMAGKANVIVDARWKRAP